MRRLLAYLSACFATYALGVLFASQQAMSSLQSLGAPVSVGVRLQVYFHDVLGMSASYLPLIAIGFLIAFVVAGLVVRLLAFGRVPLFIAAGALAVIAIHLLLTLSFEIHPIGSTRTLLGLLLQGVAGLAGGFVYVRLYSLEKSAI